MEKNELHTDMSIDIYSHLWFDWVFILHELNKHTNTGIIEF